MDVPAIDVKELKERRDKKSPHFLLDVREKDEYAIAKIDGAALIPMSELQGRVAEIPKDREVIVHCHHGGRSAQVVRWLLKSGFPDAKNLDGGIDAWSCEIDTSVPRY
ncbi:MAG: rhodanese [Elusimicrobia bacterium]|nr:rhodanese [Elusimicrobiota bacterium]